MIHKNFKIVQRTKINNGDAESIRLRHTPTGLTVQYIKNDDPNKVFFTAFRTPPFDNSGAAHILEHSVLCGSKKYKAKDLFNELMKGSINTYLNAMTFSDKTVYPVASLNAKDFFNLMDVYLDSVFHPMLYEKPEFFDIEGWNYALEKKSAPIEIKGIVYNEMKGAYSAPERVLIKKIDEMLYANTPYQFDSGGVPAAIPTLTYEKLVAFHSKYYAPANCLAFLYGDLDIQQALEMLDASVKSLGKKRPPRLSLAPVLLDSDFPKSETAFYSVREPKPNGAYYAVSYDACPYHNAEEVLALEILAHLLGGDDAAPLKAAMGKSGICGSFSVYYRSSAYQTSFSLVGKNCKEDAFEDYLAILNQAMAEVKQNGFLETAITAALNKWEFYIKEEDFGNQPPGLYYGIEAAAAWVYGADSNTVFGTKDALAAIRKKAGEGLFEQLFEKYFLQNPRFIHTQLLPKERLMESAEEALAERLADLKSSLADEELKQLVRRTKALDRFRKKPVSDRVLRKIPKLQISDLPKEVETFDYTLHENALLLASEKEDIEYIHLYFDIGHIPAPLLPYCGLLKYLLGKTATPEMGAETLIEQINTYAGKVSCTTDVLQQTDGSYTPRFNIKIRTLHHNTERVLHLVQQMIQPVWEDGRLRQLLDETLLGLESYFSSNGHSAAATRSLAHIFPASNAADLTGGIGFYREIAGRPLEEIKSQLTDACKCIFQKQQLFIGVSAKSGNPSALKKAERFAAELLQGEKPIFASLPVLDPVNEGFILDGGVSYDAVGYNFYQVLPQYSGQLQVARSLLNLTHLWHEIRNKGGAYGCGCNLSRNGMLSFYSYRDPEIDKTYRIFDASFEFLKTYQEDADVFSKYIINAIKPFTRPYKGYEALDTATANHLLGLTDALRQQERDEILSATPEDIHALGEALGALTTKAHALCTLGDGAKISGNPIFSLTAPLRRRGS